MRQICDKHGYAFLSMDSINRKVMDKLHIELDVLSLPHTEIVE